jgi:pimeloyl-ACP methyl ester carboxylesterase
MRVMAMNAYMDACKDARTVSVPTLVLHMKGDMAVSISEGREIAREVSGAEFVELPGANHCMIRGHPGFAEFFQEIEPFLKANIIE